MVHSTGYVIAVVSLCSFYILSSPSLFPYVYFQGKAGEMIDRGDNTYGGKYVINPSGGLISKGHPLGATGLAQCSELCWQLRGEAGPSSPPSLPVCLSLYLSVLLSLTVSLSFSVSLSAPLSLSFSLSLFLSKLTKITFCFLVVNCLDVLSD